MAAEEVSPSANGKGKPFLVLPATISSMLEGALLYANLGLPVFPVNPQNKRPYGGHGFHDATCDEDQIKRWWKRTPTAMIATPTGLLSGIFAVDLDRKEAGKDGVATWKKLAAEHGGVPLTLSSTTPSTGEHHIFRHRYGLRCVVLDQIAPGVEIKADGGYIVLPPSFCTAPQFGRGARYMWNRPLADPAEPPDWLVALIQEHNNNAPDGEPAPSDPSVPFERIVAALSVIDPDIERKPWINIGCALYTQLGDEAGFKLWNEWSSKAKEKYKEGEMDGQWKSIVKKKYPYSIATVFWHANQAQPDWDKSEEPNRPGTPDDGGHHARQYELIWAKDVIPRAKDWLWKGHLLRGAMELLTGIPGLGKSQVQLSYAARVSTGCIWPDGYPGKREPANVILVTVEDSLDQEIIPRLIAANADLSRICFLKKIKRDKKQRMFLLGEDIETLTQVIKDVGNVGMVAIDPITAFMGKVDSHRATDVRGQLGPLADLAERMNVAISAVTHPPKYQSQRAIDHFIGSQAFIAAGRVGHLCLEEIERDEDGKPVHDEEGKVVTTGRYLFTNPKTNVFKKMPTLAYTIEEVVVAQDATTNENIASPYVVWDATPLDLTADQALASASSKAPRDKGPDVRAFLEDTLANGPVPQKKVEERAALRGISLDQLKRMKEKLCVQSDKSGFEGGVDVVFARASVLNLRLAPR